MKKFNIILFVFCVVNLTAQSIDRQVIGNAGGGFSTGNFEISQTVGEAVTQSFTTGSAIISQGFQQGYTSAPPVSTEELNLDDAFSYYPNPVTSSLFLNFKNRTDQLKLNIKVYDLNGNLLLQQSEIIDQGFGKIIELNMGNLSIGNYIVELNNYNGALSRIQIVKVE